MWNHSGVTTAPADSATQGAREGRGALVPTHRPIFHDIVVGYASSCLWAQHNLLRIVRSLGGGPYDHVLQPLQGEGRICIVTPLCGRPQVSENLPARASMIPHRTTTWTLCRSGVSAVSSAVEAGSVAGLSSYSAWQ